MPGGRGKIRPEDNPKPFQKGVVTNPNGRPRKYVSLLKGMAYSLDDINITIQNMMAMSIEEVKEVWENKTATVIEKTIAGAIKKSLENGSLYSMETLLSRIYGKPKESADVNNTGELTIKVKYEQGSNDKTE